MLEIIITPLAARSEGILCCCFSSAFIHPSNKLFPHSLPFLCITSSLIDLISPLSSPTIRVSLGFGVCFFFSFFFVYKLMRSSFTKVHSETRSTLLLNYLVNNHLLNFY